MEVLVHSVEKHTLDAAGKGDGWTAAALAAKNGHSGLGGAQGVWRLGWQH
jgi:hypothetical protein